MIMWNFLKIGISIFGIFYSSTALADTYKILTSFPIGSVNDIVARQLAIELSDDTDKFVVENKIGASGDLTLITALTDCNNGRKSLIFSWSSPFTINDIINKDVKLDRSKFKVIAPMLDSPFILVSLYNLNELKTKDRILAGVSGNTPKIQLELFSKYINRSLDFIYYKTNNDANTALIKKEIDITLNSATAFPPFIFNNENIKIIGTTFKIGNYTSFEELKMEELKYFNASSNFAVVKDCAFNNLDSKITNILNNDNIKKLMNDNNIFISNKSENQIDEYLLQTKNRMMPFLQ